MPTRNVYLLATAIITSILFTLAISVQLLNACSIGRSIALPGLNHCLAASDINPTGGDVNGIIGAYLGSGADTQNFPQRSLTRQLLNTLTRSNQSINLAEMCEIPPEVVPELVVILDSSNSMHICRAAELSLIHI